jgi:hypothetical protein
MRNVKKWKASQGVAKDIDHRPPYRRRAAADCNHGFPDLPGETYRSNGKAADRKRCVLDGVVDISLPKQG